MGSSQSSQFYNPYSGDYAVDDAQVQEVRAQLREMGIVGANEEVLGHALAALNSKSKDHMIRDLADDLGRALNLPALSSKGKTTQEILDAFSKYFPGSTKTPGKAFSSDAGNQKKMLDIMAKLLNKHSGKVIIDANADHKLMARQIGEVLHSLGVSVFNEYNSLRNEIQTILTNIETTEEIMKKFHERILGIAKSNTDAEIVVSKFEEAYKAAKEEHDRQTVLLKGILDSESKPNPDLEKIIAETGDFHKAIKEIKGEPGTKDFSDAISYAFGLYRTNAQMSKIVEDKLKILDMTLKQYKDLANLTQLKQHVAKHVEESLNNSVAPQKLQDMLSALNALTFYFPQRNDVAGADEEAKVGGLRLDKRAEKSKKLNDALILAFHSAVSRNLEAFTHAGNAIADDAVKLPNSAELDTFMKMLDLLPTLDRKVYLSLIGNKPNILAKQDRESYISHAHALIESIKALEAKKVPLSDHFRDMRLSLEGLIDTLNIFSKKFEEGIDFRSDTEPKTGAWDVAGLIRTVGDKASALSEKAQAELEKLPARIDNAAAQASNIANSVGNAAQTLGKSVADARQQVETAASMQKFGRGEEESVSGGDYFDTDLKFTLPEINRISKNFERTKSVIKYRHRVAMMRQNMKNATKESSHYGEDYESVTGRSVANLVNDSTKKLQLYKKLQELLANQDVTVEIDAAKVSEYNDLGQRFVGPQGMLAMYNALPSGTPAEKLAKTETKKDLIASVTLLSQQELTKVNLYKTAESIDLYLKSFGEQIIKSPESLQDIFNILDSTEIATKWYDSNPGDKLCEVFETFPYGFNQNAGESQDLSIRESNVKQVLKKSNKSHYYAQVLAATGLAAFNRGNYVDSNAYKEALGANSDALADIIAALGRTAESPDYNNGVKQDLDAAGLANEYAQVGNPYIFITGTDKAYKLVKNIEGSLETGILKNIMSMFVSIGDKFGDQSLSKKAPISPILAYKHLRQYMLHSAYAVGSSDTNVIAQVGVDSTDNVRVDFPFKQTNSNTALDSIGRDDVVIGVAGERTEQALPAAVGVVLRSVDPVKLGIANDLFAGAQVTDKIFVSIIKSMIAKIFTAIGTYNMLNRPADSEGISYRAPLRLILGAGDNVKILPEAVELYIRLPLLAEWYRETLKLDENAVSKFIGMLPEADGTFSNLIDLFFDKLVFVKEGTYSDTDITNIVSEVNKLFLKFGSTRGVIDEFVNEINRRIGVLDAARSKQYKDLRQKRNPYDPDNSDRYTDSSADFSLSTIDEDDTTNRPTPSSLFVTESAYLSKKSKPREIFSWNETNDILSSFYRKISENFNNAKLDDILELDNKYSFTKLISTKTLEVKNAQSDDEKFRIIKAAITSIGKFTPSGKEATMVLFHELVIYPLQQLGLLYDSTKNFEEVITDISDVCQGQAGILDSAGNFKLRLAAYLRVSAVNAVFPAVTLGGNPVLPALGQAGAPVNTLAAAFLQPDQSVVTKFISAYLTDPRRILTALVESIYRVCSGGLVSHDILSDSDSLILTINFSKMRELVGLMIGDVKKNIDKFRGVVDPTIIEKYEKSNDDWALYNLENKFYNVSLDGKAGVEKTLDYLNQKIKLVTDLVFGEHEIAVNPANQAAKFRFNQSQLANIYAPLLSVAPAGAMPLPVKYINMAINRTNKPVLGLNNLSIPSGNSLTGALTSVLDYNARALDFNASSLTGILVRLLIEYVGTVYDETTAKFYSTALNNLMNSSFGSTILRDDGGVDDRVAMNLDNSADLLPRSLCNILKYSYSHVDIATNNKIYISSDLSSMPQFYKDKLAALLPVFRSLFGNIGDKIKMLGNILKVSRFNMVAPNNLEVVDAATTIETREKVTRLFDKSSDLINVLLTSIKDTLAELADNGTFFEPTRGFIESYKANSGRYPLMLNSTLSRLYRVANQVPAAAAPDNLFNDVLPDSITSAEFKFVYGSRALEKSHVVPDDFPGLKHLVEQHNIRSANQFHFDLKELSGYLQRSHESHEYLEDVLVLRNAITSQKGDVYVLSVNPALPRNVTYQWSELRSETVIRLTEDTDQNAKVKEFIAAVYDVNTVNKDLVKLDDQREILRRYNIIDLNIVPINVNALQRELPLINLINYSWAFDNLMSEMLDGSNNTGSLLENLMKDPHGKVSAHEYFDIFPRIVRGNMGVEGLGRPQYLGEEIYNKALFGEVYSNLVDVSPASAAAKKEGRSLKQAILEGTKYMAKRAILDQPANSGHGQVLNAQDQIDRAVKNLSDYFDNPNGAAALQVGNVGESVITWIADRIIFNLKNGTVKSWNPNEIYVAGQKWLTMLAPNRSAMGVAVAATPFNAADIAEIRRILDVSFDSTRDSDIIALKPEDSISYPYYNKETKKTELVTLKMREGTRAILHNAGYLRFDTVLVRNIVWLTNLQRLTRLALRRELFWHDTKVVSHNAATSSGVTELYGNDLVEIVKPGYNPYVPFRY